MIAIAFTKFSLILRRTMALRILVPVLCYAFLTCVQGKPVETDIRLIETIQRTNVPTPQRVSYYSSSHRSTDENQQQPTSVGAISVHESDPAVNNARSHQSNSANSVNTGSAASILRPSSKTSYDVNAIFDATEADGTLPKHRPTIVDSVKPISTAPKERKVPLIYSSVSDNGARSDYVFIGKPLPPASLSPGGLALLDDSGEARDVEVLLAERTEIVTLGPGGAKNNIVMTDGGGMMNIMEINHNVAVNTQQQGNNTLTRMPNVFLSEDSAIWAGCALVLICSIIIIVLIYSRICRTGPYQDDE